MLAVSALVEDQDRVTLSPAIIALGAEAIVTVGSWWTVTVTDAVPTPPGPVAVMMYVVVSDGDTVSVPLGDTDSISGSIVTVFAFVVFHERVVDSPTLILGGSAAITAVGG